MSQILVRPEIKQKAKSEYKLSEIWDWASKHLIQVKKSYGEKRQKKACAYGAINYFFSDDEENPYPTTERFMQTQNIVKPFWDKNLNIPYLNDVCGWTFKMFADKARELGL